MKIIKLLIPLMLMAPLSSQADILLIGDTPTVMTEASTPKSGMSMNSVLHKYGKPASRVSSMGKVTKRNPKISVWTYGQYKVYFENSHVIHTLIMASINH